MSFRPSFSTGMRVLVIETILFPKKIKFYVVVVVDTLKYILRLFISFPDFTICQKFIKHFEQTYFDKRTTEKIIYSKSDLSSKLK